MEAEQDKQGKSIRIQKGMKGKRLRKEEGGGKDEIRIGRAKRERGRERDRETEKGREGEREMCQQEGNVQNADDDCGCGEERIDDVFVFDDDGC